MFFSSQRVLTVVACAFAAARFLDSADLTTGELAALVAALLLAAVCIGLAIGAFMYLRLRRKMDPLKERLHRREPGQ